MNVIIKNENSQLIDNILFDDSKTLVGKFTLEDLNNQLSSVNYNYAIIDLTSIRNYYDDTYLFSFLSFFSVPSRVIIVLNDGFVANSKMFLSKLIDKGYYNFATSDSAINRLLEKGNSYEDVKIYLNGYDNLKQDSIVSGKEKNTKFETDKIIIGIENGIPHSGATTFMYLLLKSLSSSVKVKGVEMIKNDSKFFHDDRVISCDSRSQLELIIKTLQDVDVFVIDLNGSDVKNICNKVFYLIEPGVIKLNKLIKGDSATYNSLIGKNVVLNRSNILNDQLSNFEYETKFNVVGNIPNINERLDNNIEISKFIKKMNLDSGLKKGFSFFNIFR